MIVSHAAAALSETYLNMCLNHDAVSGDLVLPWVLPQGIKHAD